MISPLWFDGPFQVHINGPQVLRFFSFMRIGLNENPQAPATGLICPQFGRAAGGIIGQGLANAVFIGDPFPE